MSKSRIESYIPHAMEVLAKEFENGVISSVYNGYISSFGASVMQSGLKPTLALFENKNSQSQGDKDKLTKIILRILDNQHKGDSLLKYILGKPNEEAINKQKIIDIAIAVKLSIRTFKLDKGERDE
jgi:CRISPR-associated protein Cmr5